MPWSLLRYPSLQLSTVKALLAQRKIDSHVFNFSLAWLQRLLDAGFAISDYDAVVQMSRGLGEWIFAVAPFRAPTAADDEAYASFFVDGQGQNAELLETSRRMRELAPAFLDECVDRVVALEPRVVGFTSTFQQNVPALAVAQRIKARAPEIVTVFGGANCDDVMGDALHRAFSFVDVVVRGEAEGVVGPLFEELVAGSKPSRHPGICFRDGEERVVVPIGTIPPMTEVPLPDHDDYFRDLEALSLRADLEPISIPFESARGCWWGYKHHCTFCGLNRHTIKFRSKSAQRTFDELMTLAKRHEVTRFSAADNIVEMTYFEALFPILQQAGVDLTIFYETKANLKKSQVAAMAAAGVHEIQPGIESLDTSILTLMRKGTTAFQNIRILKWSYEYRIKCSWNVIFGFPGEDPAAYARMTDLVPSLVHLGPPYYSGLDVHRFSPYHSTTEQFPIRITGPKPFYKHIYPLEEAALTDIAYTFSFSYTDRPDRSYSAPLVEALEDWQKRWPTAKLEMRRGPGFIEIEDTRSDTKRVHRLGETESKIYTLLDTFPTPHAVAHELAKNAPHGAVVPTTTDVERFAKELVSLRLAFGEDGKYLPLATPARPPL